MAYYPFDNISIFPSNNAIDSGKLTDERNLRHIPQRITSYSYKLLSSDFEVSIVGKNITIGLGSANINGYSVITTDSIEISASSLPLEDYKLALSLDFHNDTDTVLGDDGTNCLGLNVDLIPEGTSVNDFTLILGIVTVESSTATFIPNPDILHRMSSEHVRVLIESESKNYDVQTFLNGLGDRYISKVSDDTFAGNLLPLTNNDLRIGSASFKLNEIYATSFKGKADESIKATGDKNGDDITSTYAKLNSANTFSAANTFTSDLIVSGVNGVLKFGSSNSINSNGVANLDNSRFSGLGINTAYDPDYKFKVSGSSLFSGVTNFGNTNYNINTVGASKLNTGVFNSNLTVGISTLNGSYALYVSGNANCTGDITANRVYNAVYNDIADFVKKDKSENFEPGDIISLKRGTDTYTLANRLNASLVVGVYSDSYGHVMGGENLPNMEDNLENYIPIAIAGNVFVKILGEIQAGDLITVSEVDGVGSKVKNAFTSYGCIVGKALESKTIQGVGKIKMQVMLA